MHGRLPNVARRAGCQAGPTDVLPANHLYRSIAQILSRVLEGSHAIDGDLADIVRRGLAAVGSGASGRVVVEIESDPALEGISLFGDNDAAGSYVSPAWLNSLAFVARGFECGAQPRDMQITVSIRVDTRAFA